MTLTSEDLNKIAALLRPVEERMESLEAQVNSGFDKVHEYFDGLYKRDEDREQEYLVLRGQIARLEERMDKTEKKAA